MPAHAPAAQQQSSCQPQVVFAARGLDEAALVEARRVPVDYDPVIYPPGWGFRELNVFVATADQGQDEFVSGAIGVVVFPLGTTEAGVTLWHPPGAVTNYRMYALDAAGEIISVTETRGLSPLGEETLRVASTPSRPIRAVLIGGISGANFEGGSSLIRDSIQVQAPLFIKQIQIPTTP
jgi:hypothetical protein